MYLIKLAFRSLFYRKRQYASLFLVCVFGVAFSLFSIYLMNGMLHSLSSKAKIYYGGDLQWLRGDTAGSYWEVGKEIDAIRGFFPSDAIISPRFDLDAATSAFYYEGVGVRQRVIKGVDFVNEKDLFAKFNFVSEDDGKAFDVSSIDGTNGVLLSERIAQMLTVKNGDVITFMLYDCHGYLNTVELTVMGVFRDSSLFGMYTSYMDINMLRKAFGYADSDFANRIAISFTDRDLESAEIKLYEDSLAEKFNLFKVTDDKRVFYDAMPTMSEPTYALVPLAANLKDVEILIEAMKIICSFIIVMLVIIIIVGISSTYRVLVMKRINEIGIYMAIGTKKWQIYASLLFETMFLLFFGCAFGFLLSEILCFVSSFLSFSFVPAFDIFLVNGYLKPILSVSSTCNLIFVILLFSLLAVGWAVHKSVNVMPVKALATTE